MRERKDDVRCVEFFNFMDPAGTAEFRDCDE